MNYYRGSDLLPVVFLVSQGPLGAMMDAHMLSLSTSAYRRLCDKLSAQERGDGMGYPPQQGH